VGPGDAPRGVVKGGGSWPMAGPGRGSAGA
jgi:hypothetical protein